MFVQFCIFMDTFHIFWTAAIVQYMKALVQQAEGWVFESQLRQTLVVKTGSDSSTAKRSAADVTGPRR